MREREEVGGPWVEKKKRRGLWGRWPSSSSEPNKEGSRQGGRPVEGAGVARVYFIGTGRRCSAWVEHAKLVLAYSNGGPASLQ
jgi:hypothetical protein